MSIADLVAAPSQAPSAGTGPISRPMPISLIGVVLMFGPVALAGAVVVQDAGQPARVPAVASAAVADRRSRCPATTQPLPLFKVTMEDGTHARARAGAPHRHPVARWSIPPIPSQQFRVPIDKRMPVRHFSLATENYTEPLAHFDFPRYPRQLGLRDGGRDADHAPDQLHGRLSRSRSTSSRARTPRC